MSCKDCYTGCEQVIPDKCVQYTGPAFPLLGICTGDYLSDVEIVILEKLVAIINGSGIDLSAVTLNCPYTQTLIGTADKTLAVLIQKLFDSQCTLKGLIDGVIATNGSPTVFSTGCLTLPANPTKDQILQAAVSKLCAVDTRLTAVETGYVKLADLPGLINGLINSGTTINYHTRMVPNVAVAYFGSLSNFDNNGKGIASLGFDKIYLCNGLNSAPDLRGRAIVGAVRNVPGSTLAPEVDPLNLNNPNTNYAVGDKFGESYHKLTSAELPQHTHEVNEQAHNHDLAAQRGGDNSDHTNALRVAQGDKEASEIGFNTIVLGGAMPKKTGITLGSTGGGIAHDNRQPSVAAYWIMYIP